MTHRGTSNLHKILARKQNEESTSEVSTLVDDDFKIRGTGSGYFGM
jgi:hypothetical protein